jgi:hypothetical protein
MEKLTTITPRKISSRRRDRDYNGRFLLGFSPFLRFDLILTS